MSGGIAVIGERMEGPGLFHFLKINRPYFLRIYFKNTVHLNKPPRRGSPEAGGCSPPVERSEGSHSFLFFLFLCKKSNDNIIIRNILKIELERTGILAYKCLLLVKNKIFMFFTIFHQFS